MNLTCDKEQEQFNEIINFIKNANMLDVFTFTNDFFDKFGKNIYSYIRVSTDNQDFGRQLLELYKWCKTRNITIPIKNIFFDKYTGKKLDRGGYNDLKLKIGSWDYLIVSELNRLGRNWDMIKDEWESFQKDNINIIIQDNNMLSAPLPNENSPKVTLEYKFIQSIVFNAINYVASKKIEEVSRTTKDGLEKAKLKGVKLGRPVGKYTSLDNFINVLKLQIEDGYSLNPVLNKTRFPKATYFNWLKKYMNENNLSSKEEVYNYVKLNAI